MKKIIIYFLLIASSAFVIAQNKTTSNADCNVKEMRKEGVKVLSPFYYSSSKATEIEYRDTSYSKEIMVPMFKGESYRLIFNGKKLPAGVEINIYDRDNSHANRKAVFSHSSSSSELIVYEPEVSKKYFINYRIPAGSNLQSSCIVFVIGYQLTFIK